MPFTNPNDDIVFCLSQKAKTLAMSVNSGFAELTPQSILRSSLRIPLASPSVSPGRSLTPPLQLKETRISFMEEDMSTQWTAGVSLIIILRCKEERT